MSDHRIAWMPGDGVGADVMDAALLVLDRVGFEAEYVHADVGWEFWCKEGTPLPERTLEVIENTDCAMFGAITSKPKEEADRELAPELKGRGLVYYSPIVQMRQKYQLYSNMRPCKAFPGNPLNYRDDIDLVVFRENTEDLYSGVEFYPFGGEVRKVVQNSHPRMQKFADVPDDEMAVSLRIITKRGASRIIRKAFEFAREHSRDSVTVVEKPNVIRETSGLMLRTARAIAQSYDIPLWETNIDAMCMWLVKNPQDYDVLVTSNLFGDIVSDLCAQLVGGLGFAAAGNIGDNYAVFEPTHGSAPKYYGMNKVNPVACILAARLMLDHLGEHDKADAVLQAVGKVIAAGEHRTYDMGGSTGTKEMAQAIADAI
ncbi:MAG: isocitrate/isopropylmalate dehydrogenase family protein [Planctomycetota bacterium]|nr:isocitrate/isopropylmalate dehydrogenase family protein [Planctomycetota bacterium]